MAAYVKHDLGNRSAGAVVEVTPAHAANVYLLDERNFSLYRRGRRYRGVGGSFGAGVSVHLTVESDGHWFVVVDLAGKQGTIRASVRMVETEAIDADATHILPTALTADQLLRGVRR
jgi:hypothetical protein